MNKTTTRFTLFLALLLTQLSLMAQHPIISIRPTVPYKVCQDAEDGTTITIAIKSDYPNEGHTYEYRNGGGSWNCCFGTDKDTFDLYVGPYGQLVELRFKFYLNGDTMPTYQNLGQYYSPVNPVINAAPFPSLCSAPTGRIEVTDQSTNFAAMPRLFKIYNANNILLDTARVNSATHPFNNLPPGTYKVVIETLCNNIIAERTGIVVSQISQNPILEIALSGHDDCLVNNINASVVLPESIPTAGVQYRMDGGTWQASNTFTNVTPWLSHQFSARLSGCFEANTTRFVSELSIPRIQSLERAKDTDCTPANNEIRVFVPEGSDAQIQFNHSGGWYNPGQWIGPLPDGTLHIRARSAYLPSCYRDTLITLSEHGSVSLIGADASNLNDCTLGNIGLQLRTEPAVSSGLEYFVEGKGWQSSAQFSGLSNGDKRIAIRSTGLCQVGLAADTLTLSEIIAPQIESIAPQGHDDCVVGNAGFWVYLVQSVSGVKFRINGGAWQPGNLFQNRPAGNYLVEAARADGTCVSSLNYALVETGSVSITGLSKANENDCVVGNAQFQVLHTGGSQQGLKFRLNGGAWQDSAIFRNLTRMAVNVEAQIQKPSCTSSIVAWPDSIREQSNFPEIASVTITGDKNCTVGAQVAFTLKVPMTATYWLSPTKNNTTGVFPGLASGTYTFQVYKTANGCVQTRVVTIDEKLNFTLDSLRVQGGDDCLNNNAVVTIYHPSGNNYGLQFREVSRNTPWQNSNAFPLTTHGVGQYNLEARNANGCTLWSGSIYGQERLNPEITGVVGIDGLSDCSLGNVTAQVQLLNASAGTTKQYRLNGGAWNLSSTLPGFRHGSSNLVELTYNFGGIGTQQCTINKSIVIDEKAKEITGVLLDAATLSDCSLNNVKATIQVDGSTSNLRYVVTGKTEGTSNIFTNLNNGQYKAIIRDVVSTCRDTFNFSVAETPALALPTPVVQNVVCFGAATGSISISPTGGMAPYTYLWSAGATSASVTGLAAGTYSVAVTDNRGCSLSQTVQVTGPAQSNLPQISFMGDTSICKGASFSVSASGVGTYNWNTGATSSAISGSPENTTTYTVTVTNGLGCSASATRIIKVNALPVPNIEGINKICVGQSTTLTATGGSSYAWQHGPTGANITVNPSNTTTYKVTVTNQAQCSAIYNRTVIVNANPVAEILGLPNNPVCGDSTVTLTASGIGSYFWNTGETSTTIQPLITGRRSVVLVVKNANACADTAQAEILFNTRPVAQVLGGDIACYGNSTVLTAGLATSYRWNTGATSASISVVAPLQTATYTVTLSNGLGCSVSAEKVVKVPDTLSLSYQLDKDQDCIAKNVSIIPQASGGQGSKTFTLLRSGELYPYTDLNGWGSGEYALVVKDSLGCVATKALKIVETPVKITKLNLLGTDDCVPGNTQIAVETEGNRLPLVYRLDGVVQSGATIALPREEKTYSIEVTDAAGCVVSREEYYEDYDAVRVYEDNISPVTDCSTPNGAIHFVYVGKPGTEQKDYSISVDDGTTWHPSTNVVINLRPGLYQTAARNDLAGCVVQGPQVQITAPYCLPEAGFTKSTLHITSPTQRIALPWRVDKRAWGNADKPFSLRIYRVGDGKPHFVDPNIATATEPQEKSVEPGSGFTIEYAVDFEGSDERELVLQPNAADHLEPGFYTFLMEGEGVDVDPFRKEIKVIVDLAGKVVVQTFSVCGGDPITLSVSSPLPGECYSWEGVDAGNVSKVTIPHHIPGKTYTVWRLKDLKIKPEVFYGDPLANGNVPYQVKAYPPRVCKGSEVKLEVKGTAPGWTFEWYDGRTSESRNDYPDVTTTYKLWATSPNGCRYPLSVTVEVDDLTGVKINPAMPVACPGGNAKLTLQGLPSGYSVGWFYTEPGSFDERGAGTGVTVNAAKIGKWRALISGACTALMTTQDPARNKNVEVKEASAVNIGNLVQSMGGFYFIPGVVTYGDKAADLANFPPVPEMGSGGEVEVLGKERDIQVALDAFSSGQIKDMVQAIVAEDAWINEAGTKKVFIVTPNAFCQKQDVLAEALKKIREYDLGYVVVPVSGKGVYVINTTFKQPAMSPVSNAHRDFIKARVECMKASGEANSSQKLLGVVFNTLIDNYEASYEALAEAMVGVDCRQVVLLGEDPRPELRETDCKTLKANTRFFNAAALVVTLNAGFGPIFNKSSYIVQSSQKGCLVGYKNNSGALYSGRYYVKPEGYYHVGFHPQVKDYNQKNLANFPVVSAFQNAVVWFAKDLGDLNDAKAENYQVHEITGFALKASGSTGAGNYVADGICVNCNSSGYGSKTFNMESSKITAEYFFKSKPDLKPEELTFWNVKLDQPFPREQVESSTDPNDPLSGGFIIQIPREAPAAPITLYVRYKKGESIPYSIHYLDQCQWKPYDYKVDQYLAEENKLIFSRLLHLFSEIWDGGHLAFDVAGIFFPIADIANAAWYFYQKSPIEGTLSLIGAIPLFGDVVLFSVKGALKLFVKVGNKSIELLTLLKKLADGTEIDMAAILKGLNSSDIPSSDLSRLFQALNAPQFADTDAKALLQAFQADPQGMAKLWSVVDGLGSSLDNFADFVKWAEDVKHLDFIKSNPLSYKIYQQAVSDGLPTSRIATLFADLRNPANKLDLMAELLKDPGLVRVWALVDEVGSSLKLDTDVLKRLKADLNGDLEQFIRARGKSGLAAWNILDGAKKCFN